LRILFAIFILIKTSSVLSAQDTIVKPPFLEFNGYLKDLQSVYFTDDISSLTSANLIHNRLNFKANLSRNLIARLELRNRIFWGDQIKSIPDFGNIIDQYNGYVSMSKLWVNEPELVAHSVIDRFLVEYVNTDWDIRLGRQRINWGINTIWNPNDLFNAYNYLDFDYEERPGNDAMRIQRFFRNSGAIEVAWRIGKNKDEQIAALMYRFNQSQYDFQFLGGLYNHDYVIGTGWAGHILEAGFKGEASYFHPRESFGDTTGTLSFSFMTDLTFSNAWYVSVSFLYNSNPPGIPSSNLGIYSPDLSAKQLSPYEFTYYAGVMKTLSPITAINMSVIYSPTFASLLLFPTFTWNASETIDISLVSQNSFADTQQGYRTQGNALFLRIKWNF
jgi:hypothetical protein